MASKRAYIKIDAGIPDNPKIVEVGEVAAWLYLAMLCYCARYRTDGVVPEAALPRISSHKRRRGLVAKLLDAGLLHGIGHDCQRCPQPASGTLLVHGHEGAI